MSLPLLEKTAELQEFSRLPRLPRSSVPYSRLWAAVLVLNDTIVLSGAHYVAGTIGYTHHILATRLPTIVAYDVVYVLLWLLIFERLGLYRRTAALTKSGLRYLKGFVAHKALNRSLSNRDDTE